ncbi:hypothetical protein AVEN_59035-1 [Araneus ventricosus]|uniref:RNase H type-1 domain-containing protein n=1 Tax=Araneus ventricosus TaxID=182803 RepID=A0A4Y2NCE1_ARAVE|nr:hypothetical protein AVEN_59035-1 [Araneus ventricosus]
MGQEFGGFLYRTQTKRLHSIQRIFLVQFTRAYRATSTNALNVLTGIPTLHIVARAMYLKFQIWAELAAIGFSAGWALEHNQLVNIHTDSQSSIEAIKSAEPKSEFVNNIKEKIYSSRLLASLTWVKAHAGNPCNEQDNCQAKLPTIIGQYLDLPAPYSCVKLKIKQFIIHEWENY